MLDEFDELASVSSGRGFVDELHAGAVQSEDLSPVYEVFEARRHLATRSQAY